MASDQEEHVYQGPRPPRIRAAAQLQAQEAAHRLTSAAIAGSAARVAAGRTRSQTPSNGSTRAPSAGSVASYELGRHALRSPNSESVPSAGGPASIPDVEQGYLRDDGGRATPTSAASSAVAEAVRLPGAAAARRPEVQEERRRGAPSPSPSPSPGGGSRSPAPMPVPDALDHWLLREELRRTTEALARALAAPEAVNSLDLPGLSALRTELCANHAAALERVDDRRVQLQSRAALSHEGPERGRCVACWSRNADRVLLPCRHLCLCGTCLRSCRTTCPICRGHVADTLEVFGVD